METEKKNTLRGKAEDMTKEFFPDASEEQAKEITDKIYGHLYDVGFAYSKIAAGQLGRKIAEKCKSKDEQGKPVTYRRKIGYDEIRSIELNFVP